MENKSGKCTSCKHRIDPGGWAACDGCIHDEGLKDRYEPMTNADRIRNMTDEENPECPIARYECDGGILGGVYTYDTEEQAAEAWNRRADNG
mgnify:CR=1 FL=1